MRPYNDVGSFVWQSFETIRSHVILDEYPRYIGFPIPNASISTKMAKCDYKSDQISRSNLFFHNLMQMLSWTIWKFEFEQSCIWGMIKDQFISGVYSVSIWKRLLSKSYVKKSNLSTDLYTCKTPQNYAKLGIWGESELKYLTKIPRQKIETTIQ